MESTFTIIKILGSIVALIVSLIGVVNFKFTRRSAMINEYNHAKKFLSEVNTLHPYAKDLGFSVIAGSNNINTSEIEYVINLEDPVKSLKYYVKGRTYFIPFDELKYPRLKFKLKYRSEFKRKTLSNIYMCLYFVFALASISPSILSEFITYSSFTEYISISCISLFSLGYLAHESLQSHLRIHFAEKLHGNQIIHKDLEIIKA